MRYCVLLAVILLSGCGLFSKEQADFSCPKTGLVPHASTVTFLTPDGKDTVAEAALQAVSGECSFKDKEAAAITLTLPFVVKKGAAGAALKNQELPYFIAVLSPEEDILQRQAFSTKVDFDNTGTGSGTEEHYIKIPLPPSGGVHNYKVAIGFVLTPEQLKYNKEHK